MDRLKGKTILFVDDKRMDVETYMECLRELGANTIYKSGPNRAWDYIRQNTGEIDLVVADLYMSKDYSVLKRFERTLGSLKRNQGRLLEYAIDELGSDRPPVIYLSNDVSFYGEEDEQKKAVIFPKSIDDAEAFNNYVLSLLS